MIGTCYTFCWERKDMSEQIYEPRLEQALEQFIASLPPEKRWENQRYIEQFVQWYGREKPVGKLSAPEVANYSRWVSASTSGPSKRLTPVKAFLTYIWKEGLIEANLAIHLRVSKSSVKQVVSSRRRKVSTLTAEGMSRLEAELMALKEERPHLADELRRAAADKDFSENAPLDAVKERQGHIEARIRELETALKSAVVIGTESRKGLKVELGTTATLSDITSGGILTYTLVDPREVNPAQGKISIGSPVGRALLGRMEGDVAEVTVPAGRLQYRIEKIA
jgi:transcription elongation factor GreA